MNKIVYGINTIESLLTNKSHLILKSYVIYDKNIKSNIRLKNLINKIKLKKIYIKYISKYEFKNIINVKNNQNICVFIKNNKDHIYKESDIINFIKDKKKIFILILENIQDPRNLGACFRSADSANVDCVIITKNKSSPINETVRKVASGATDNLIIFIVNNLSNIIKILKSNDIEIIGTSDKSNNILYNFKFSYSLAIILGSENKGIKNVTRKLCDNVIKIPTYGNTCSLNISVATGIFLFEIIRQNKFI